MFSKGLFEISMQF
uniref:Uncharacterized protein n=1 Tax=Anguilla anguilla TaxID=7936 RepID=A0A0E9VYY5_ANGAN